MRRTKWDSPPSDDALRRAREAGLSDTEIAREYGLSRSTVWKRFKKMEAMGATTDVPQTTVKRGR